MGATMSSGRRGYGYGYYGRGGGSGRGRAGGLVSLLALQVLIQYAQDASRPPVTAALLVANALLYLRPGSLDSLLPSVSRVAFNPHLIIQYGDLTRFFLSAFYHLSETHFFYNMTSLLWKGVHLETSMGSAEFASMVVSLLGLSQGITLLLSKGLLLFGDGTAYYDQYAVGFSGVLFGMKVVMNAWSDDFVSLYGLVIPAKYAAWAELLLVQAFIPGTSFIGHLSGILAGLAYLGLKRSFSGPDPLSLLISGIFNVASWPVRFVQKLFWSGRPRGFTSRGRVGHRASARETGRGIWRCSTCTYDNLPSTDICEMCSTAREDRDFSRRQNLRAEDNGELSVDEVRRRRLERFGR